MTRADGSARPPFPPEGVVLAREGNLSRYEDGPDWSVERVVVGERIHILATCYCYECRGIRDEQDFLARPQHRWFGKCNLPDCAVCALELADIQRMGDEDAAEQARRRAAHEGNLRYRRAMLGESA